MEEKISVPEIPISTQIQPDTWLNIPPCIVKAFNDDIGHQEHILKMMEQMQQQMKSVDEDFKDLKVNMEGKIKRDIQDSKKEMSRQLTTVEQRMKSSLKEIQNNLQDVLKDQVEMTLQFEDNNVKMKEWDDKI